MARRTDIVPAVEAEITTTIDHWLGLIAAAMTSTAGRTFMRREFLRQLEASDAATLPTDEIIEAARSGNQAADLALREFAATRLDQWAELSALMQAFVIRALVEPIVAYPRGATDVIDTWSRDIAISVLVELTAQRWQLPATRGAATAAPSAAYFVSLMLRKRGIKLKEGRVNRIYRARSGLAARVAASLLPSCPF
jgi:hypothetical protein